MMDYNNVLNKLPEHSSSAEYISWIYKTCTGKNEKLPEIYRKLIEEQKNKSNLETPFLTIVTRTQGKRPEMLQETLLSLTGQSDTSFEVIIVGHKLDEEGKINVRSIIDALPNWMKEKIKFFEIDYGNRTAPLNYGFACSSGKYISILDDDDIVFDNWVEEFHKAAQNNNGKILHSYILSQKWETLNLTDGLIGLRAVEAPKTEFCRDFDIHEQVRMNHCPVMGLAFPGVFFRDFGISFDEELTTTEDWDYLMRVAFFAGVADIPVPTAIYRLWYNSNTSHSEHNSDEWNDNYLKIQNKLKMLPEIISAGVGKMAVYDDVVTVHDNENNVETLFNTNKLYIATKSQEFCEENAIVTDVLCDGAKRIMLKYLIPEGMSELLSIRFDPCFEGLFFISNIKIIVVYADKTIQIDRQQMEHNGFDTNEGILFAGMDPQIIIHLKELRRVKSVDVIADVEVETLDNRIRQAIDAAVYKHYHEIATSKSWRITKPLRKISDMLNNLKTIIRKLLRK